jgi:hypothetical protein
VGIWWVLGIEEGRNGTLSVEIVVWVTKLEKALLFRVVCGEMSWDMAKRRTR